MDAKFKLAILVFVVLVGAGLYYYFHVFSQPYQIVVLVVGSPSDQLQSLLTAEDFKSAKIFYAGNIYAEGVLPGTLDSFNVVIVNNASNCGSAVRKTLVDFVRAGGSLVVVGDACTVDSEDSRVHGWTDYYNSGFGEVMPARFDGARNVSDKFRIIAVDHPFFNGIRNFLFSGSISSVSGLNNATVLAVFGSPNLDNPNANYSYAILEKSVGKGKLVYFALDIDFSFSRNLMYNLILELGKGGIHAS